MSADNVTQFPSGDQPSKPRKRKADRAGLKFSEGIGDDGAPDSTLRVYQGLRGVCHALDRDSRDIDLYADLSAAASVLIDILEDRLLC
jgi:hypothetical protein